MAGFGVLFSVPRDAVRRAKQLNITMIKRITPKMAFLLLLAVACTKTEVPTLPGGLQEVGIFVGKLATRTVIDQDEAGQSVSFAWADGDVISLWARGNTSFSNALFTHHVHPDDPDGALFRGSVPLMEEGDYTYYAVYPGKKVTEEGASLKIELPTVQSGDYDPDLDIMRAEASGARLQKDRLNRTDLRFRHLTHVLKIKVPASPFGDGKLSGLCIEFPENVTGTLVFGDIADASPRIENGSNRVTLLFDEPKSAGDEIWAFIAPVDASDAEVKFTATDGTEYTYPAVSDGFRLLEAGHITPVNVGFRLREREDTLFTITVDPANLGEEVTSLHAFTLPDGLVFPGLPASGTALENDFTPLGEGRFGIRMFKDVAESMSAAEGAEAFIEVSSEHTLPQRWRSEMTSVSASGLTVSSPYLFFEDFSGVAAFSHHDDDSDTGLSAVGLDDDGLPGWSAVRAGAEAGTSLRIGCRTQYSILWTTRYHGRADSAPLSALREDAVVKVRVSFDYSFGRGSASLTPYMAYGFHTERGLIDAASGDNPALSDPVATGVGSAGGYEGDWTKVDASAEYEIEACTAAHRLVWECYTSGRATGNAWLYLDNIKVSVVQ